jgi:hypothetical protein
MNAAILGRSLWRPNPWRGGALRTKRPIGRAVLARALGVASLAAIVGTAAAVSLPEPQAREAGGAAAVAKDEARLPGGSEPQIGPQALISPQPLAPVLRSASMPPDALSPDPAVPPASLAAAVALAPEALSRTEFSTWSTMSWSALAARFGAGWSEEEFAQVAVVDGRTLLAGRRRIRLIGLDLPGPEQACRTLDGGLEPCWSRAIAQLELLTRWRRVICRYRAEGAGEAAGRCRVGSSDLAERMIRIGSVWQVSQATGPTPAPEPAASAAAPLPAGAS